MTPARGLARVVLRLLPLALLSGAAPACGRLPEPGADPASDPSPMAPMGAGDAGSAADNARAELLGPFLERYWRLPVPLQGDPPPGFSAVEASLDPQVCGACHPRQLAEWKGSLHAGAWSPGFAGQLVEGALSRPSALRGCQHCHAPLEEQQPPRADGAPAPAHDPALREKGVVCAACHVRAHQHFGPPRPADRPAPQGAVAHGGFEPRAEFQQSRFCATCHQFFDQRGPAGKPVENVFVEWRRSPQAAQGRTCQSCHMPDRAHTWRGIHDAQMVRDAVDVELRGPDARDGTALAALLLTNRDVGHAFPSYVTPRVFLALWQADADGAEIGGTRVEAAIGRKIDFSLRPAREEFDTRVLPGETFRLDYTMPRSAAAVSVQGQVRVDPAHHYRGVYQRLLRRYRDPEARAWIEQALRRADEVGYVLAERQGRLGR